MGMDSKPIIALLAMSLFLGASSASTQESEAVRDPFFSDGPRTSATASASPDSSWGRDPFNRPFEGTAPTLAPGPAAHARGQNLTGIIYGKNVRLAIIGGETFREGSMVGDQKLTDIRGHSVVFVNSTGGREEVFLEDFSIRK